MEERRDRDSKIEVERLGYEMYNGKHENRWAENVMIWFDCSSFQRLMFLYLSICLHVQVCLMLEGKAYSILKVKLVLICKFLIDLVWVPEIPWNDKSFLKIENVSTNISWKRIN